MSKRVLVIGDVILDEYTHGSSMGISAETPTVVAKYEKTERFVGGAGLVVRNLLRLGCQVDLLTVSGPEDSLFRELMNSSDPPTLEETNNLHCSPIIQKDRCFPQKRRFYVGSYKMVQYDVLPQKPLDDISTDMVCRDFNRKVVNADAVVVCDNRHGVMNQEVIQHIRKSKHKTMLPPTFVDSQVSQSKTNIFQYFGADMFFLNEKELDAVLGPNFEKDPPETSFQKIEIAEEILGGRVILKMGADGSMTRDIVVKGCPVNALDTCGAGDAFLAAYVSEGIHFANRWAALSTTYRGTYVPKLEDLERLKI